MVRDWFGKAKHVQMFFKHRKVDSNAGFAQRRKGFAKALLNCGFAKNVAALRDKSSVMDNLLVANSCTTLQNDYL